MKKKNLFKIFIALVALAAASLFVFTCDMTMIDGDNSNGRNSSGARLDSSSRYLTIYNLPDNFSIYNISNVFVHNQAGKIAQCSNYGGINVSIDGYNAIANVPLAYTEPENVVFTETGFYYVTFDINVDVDTRYFVTTDDRVRVLFINGNGYLDINNIYAKQESFLTVVGLPLNTTKYHISDVKVYNIAGEVASCINYREIIVLNEKTYTTARIPLLVSDDSEFPEAFMDTGSFQVTMTITTDIYTQILITLNDYVVLPFVKGSAIFDFFTSFGHFSGELVNPLDMEPPQIKEGSAFDLNGTTFRIDENIIVDSDLPAASGLLYLYGYRDNNEIAFEWSTQAPVYNKIKSGYYNREKRALWKMLFFIDDVGNKFLFKTKMHEEFPQFSSYVIRNDDPFITTFRSHYTLSGRDDPAPTSVSLDPGLYIVKAVGAGGGSGSALAAAFSSSSVPLPVGGDGGIVTEIFSLNRKTSFTVFTGSGGKPGDYFEQYGAAAMFSHSIDIGGGTGPLGSDNGSATYYYNPLFFFSGGAGAGGGSGSFLYSSQGYLLVAAGGGGGSGHTADSPGGAGGAGGALGSGAGGGAPGFSKIRYPASTLLLDYIDFINGGGAFFINKGKGGIGGGYLGGIAGVLESNPNGGNGYSFVSSQEIGFNGITSLFSNNYTVIELSETSVFHRSRNFAFDFSPAGDGGKTTTVSSQISSSVYIDTNNANGKGADAKPLPHPGTYSSASSPAYAGNPGEHGGNNRNSNRGGGAYGGKLLSVTESTPGDDGSITIYKIY